MISDTVATALITALTVLAGQYWSYKASQHSRHKIANTTNEKVDAVHDMANSRLTAALDKIDQLQKDNEAFRTDIRRREAESNGVAAPSRVDIASDGAVTRKLDLMVPPTEET